MNQNLIDPLTEYIRADRPLRVCLCGSTAHMDLIHEANRWLTAAGHIVVAPGCNLREPHELWDTPEKTEALKERLDDLHLAKIDLADVVIVVRKPDGTLGFSAASEREYALNTGTPTFEWWPTTSTVTRAEHERVFPVSSSRRNQETPVQMAYSPTTLDS